MTILDIRVNSNARYSSSMDRTAPEIGPVDLGTVLDRVELFLVTK